MNKLLLLAIFSFYTRAMENPDHPRYHINNKIVYLRETRESGDQEFKTVSDFNKSFQEIPIHEKNLEKEDKAVINTGLSNRTKIAIALLGAGSTIVAAIISSLLTYYSKACK